MLSRDADACYWIGRYIERAESVARMVDVHYHAALESYLPSGVDENLDEFEEDRPLQWWSMIAISGETDSYEQRQIPEDDRRVLHFLAFDPENPNSILSIWKAARENARVIREQIASEMWEGVNSSYLKLREWNVDRLITGSPHEYFQSVQNYSQLFQGILNRTLMMGEVRDWMDIGIYLERADQTARLLDVKYHSLMPSSVPAAGEWTGEESAEPGGESHLDLHAWTALLKSVCALEMFRKTYRGGMTPARIVEFLLLNPKFPASVRLCIDRVAGSLRRVGGALPDQPPGVPERLVGRLAADLAYGSSEEILTGSLHDFLHDVQVRCSAIGEAIAATYLAH
jgi:uncharacterized alpha-E superfamily protein